MAGCTAGLVRYVEEFAVDIELELPRRGVPDPDRPRALVAGEPVELVLVEAPLAGPAGPYMIWSCDGSPATARSNKSRQSTASFTYPAIISE